MKIEQLNIIISDIEDMLSKSIHISMDSGSVSPRMEFGIQLYETFPNTNPYVLNPLHHLNDVKVNFFFYNNLYDTYNIIKLRELRNYNIEQIIK
jgi:hypothetical protein